MGGKLTYQDVKKQSNAVFGQFGESKWKPFSDRNANLKNRRDPRELQNIGIGKVLVSVAMGASLEDKIDLLKKYRDRIDIIVCDKGFRPLLERGVRADYVMLCDCNILMEKWIGETIHETNGVKLIATPYANLSWTHLWRGSIYFYVNRDAIESEKVFVPIMGDGVRTIPASSNVSNAQLVFMTGVDEWKQINFSGYERFLLVGYDYSWRPGGNYYAWADPKPKRFYMTHRTVLDQKGDIVLTSENLLFSARWLAQYINGWGLAAVNCSDRGLLHVQPGDLEKELQRIDVSKSRAVQRNHQITSQAKATFDVAMQAFNKSREELLSWPSEMRQS